MIWLTVPAVFVAVLAGTRLVLAWLRHRQILDHPNDRSSHTLPTPRGGGLALSAALIGAWAWLGGLAVQPALLGAAALAALSWMDDLRGLSPLKRLLVQIAAVIIGLKLWPGPGPFFGGWLPPVLDLTAAGLLWLWFINLFNFMDGIDGISGVETVVIGGGVAVVATLAGVDGPLAVMGACAAAGALGFLWWNWHPARVFLGDVGSVPLGYLLGWLLLALADAGHWAAALILPAYYLADATITLTRRLLRGEKVWQAHREHFYQKAVQQGAGHARVAGLVLAAGLVLVLLAGLAAAGRPWAGLAGAALVVAVLLFRLARPGDGRINAAP